eukprot:2858344-Rhodomonas_salina.1
MYRTAGLRRFRIDLDCNNGRGWCGSVRFWPDDGRSLERITRERLQTQADCMRCEIEPRDACDEINCIAPNFRPECAARAVQFI